MMQKLGSLCLLLAACSDDPEFARTEPAPDAAPVPVADAAPVPAADAGNEVTAREEPCRWQLPNEALRCGVLDVPENYALPSGRRLQLPYAILPATGADAGAPVVYLNGGPGASGIAWLPIVAQLDTVRARHDIIVIEQRGNGVAEPSLVCPDDDLRACHDAFVAQGLDLAQYRTAVAARDVTSLQAALGLPGIHLFGVSYGTTLAIHVAKAHPEGLLSLVLDSPTAPNVDIAQADVESQLDAFSTLFAACAADAPCAGRYPALRQTFEQMVAALNEQPLSVAGHPLGEALGLEELDGTTMTVLTAQALQRSPQLVAAVPEIISAALARDADRMAQAIGDVSVPLPEGFPEDRVRAQGLTLSVYCAELASSRFGEVPLQTREVWPEPITQALTPDYLLQCRDGVWPVAPVPAEGTWRQ